MTPLVYETHSITEDNEAGIATGWLPGRLSLRGRILAGELGTRRRATTDIVYCSDLRRAVHTATIAFAGTGVPIRTDARPRECDYGDLNGAPVAAVAALRRRCVDEPFPNGQSFTAVLAAVRTFADDLRRDHAGRRVLVIGHSATRWALQHLTDGTPLADLVDHPFTWHPGWTFPQ